MIDYSLPVPFFIYFPIILVGCTYFFMILWFYHGWNKTPVYQTGKLSDSIKISVIVVFRNELESLSDLIMDLVNQDYLVHNLEVILVDDNSTDGSYELVRNLTEQNPHFKLIKNSGNGKKHALSEGIDYSSGELIVTTDADCRMEKNWLKTIAAYSADNKSDMILGPVLPVVDRGFFSDLVALEYISLIGATAGAAGIKHPIMNNGANMAFQISTLNSIPDPFLIKTPSGEDVFFMLNLKKTNKSEINFLKSIEAVVSTQMPSGIKEFWQQRLRWVSKSKYYHDADIIISAAIVWWISFLMFATLMAGIFNPVYFLVYTFLFIMKSIPDYLLLSKVLAFFNRPGLIKHFILLQIIYPFYVTLTGIFGLIFVKFRWKDRKY